MPVEAPLWMVALSTAFAVIIGKEIFGGTGMNIWNPALLARAFFFFSYPSMISGDKVWIAGDTADAISQATPLAQMALGQPLTYSTADMFWGFIPGSVGETSAFCILIGAVILLSHGARIPADFRCRSLSATANGRFCFRSGIYGYRPGNFRSNQYR